MPMYEYICKACKQPFEKLVRSMRGTDPVPCPKCQSTQTERQLSVFAVASENASAQSTPLPTGGGCGRCGGPGPCGFS